MATTHTALGAFADVVDLDGPLIKRKANLLTGATATGVIRRNVDGVLTDIFVTIPAVNRIRVQQKISDGRPAPVPQKFFDETAVQAADANLHPPMGPFSHVAVKDGSWSDPTLWDVGTVPGNGAVVNTSTYDVTYDVESDALIFGIHVSGTGIFRWATDRDLRLRIRTMMCHGTEFRGDYFNPITESPVEGKKRIEVIFHRMGVDPGATVNLGWNNMGPVRYYSTPKASQLKSANISIAAGATSATLSNATGANWRKGDKLLWLATSYAGTTLTDPWYDGPTQYYNDAAGGVNSGVIETNTDGYMLSHDEVVTVDTFDPVTGVLTWDEPLTYAREGALETSERGKVLLIMPVVALLSYPIRMRGATLNNPADAALDPTADLRNLQYRAAWMVMHNDDVDIRGVEILDMGRTEVDPSLAVGSTIRRATNGGVSITNPLNVTGKYPFHLHWLGAFLGRIAAIIKNMSVWSSANEQFTPGWAWVQHHARALVEDVTCYRFRGAGMVSEIATEIGQWTRCIMAWGRGDGFATKLEDRTELWFKHHGHGGIAFENQARQIMLNWCLASSCRVGYHWQLNLGIPASGVVPNFTEPVIEGGTDLRLRNPLTQAGDSSEDTPIIASSDWYGRQQPQIAPGIGNMSWGCSKHLQVIHRAPQRQDSVPMVWRECHSLRCPRAVVFGPYVNSYYLYDSLFIGTGAANVPGVTYDSVSWRQMLVGCVFSDFASVDIQWGGLVVNYEGHFVDNKRVEGPLRFGNPSYFTTANDAVTYPYYNIMGDSELDPGNPKRYIPRVGRNAATAEFPLPYPLEPYGLKLPGGSPAVPFGSTPYFVQSSGPHTYVAGNVRNQFQIVGTIRDSAGDRRLGDFISPESWPAGVLSAFQVGYKTSKMTGEQCVIRNGCYQVGGVWKTRARWPDADRLTGKFFWFFSDEITLTSFDPAFLAAHTIDPATIFLDTEFLPELVQPIPAPIDTTRVPLITSEKAISISQNEELSQVIRANTVHPKFTIDGGPDAAAVQLTKVAGVTTLTTVASTIGTPTSLSFNIRVTDALGNFTVEPHTLTNTKMFRDAFTGTNGQNLQDRPGWVQLDGTAGAMIITGNALAGTLADTAGASYASPDLGSANHYVECRFLADLSQFVLTRLTNRSNWFGFRRSVSGTIEVYSRVGGTLSLVGTHGSVTATDVMRLSDTGSTYTVTKNGAVVGTGTVPGGVPVVSRCGVITRATGAANVDDYKSGLVA